MSIGCQKLPWKAVFDLVLDKRDPGQDLIPVTGRIFTARFEGFHGSEDLIIGHRLKPGRKVRYVFCLNVAGHDHAPPNGWERQTTADCSRSFSGMTPENADSYYLRNPEAQAQFRSVLQVLMGSRMSG
jgi:hypothetical protein